MKPLVTVIIGWALAASAPAAPLRVAAFNVHNSLGAPGTTDYENVARILERIGADVVALEELQSDYSNLASLQARLGLPYGYRPSSSSHAVGILSRHPLLSTNLIYQSGMVRTIPLVRVDVPGVADDPWIAGVHLKCCGSTGGSEQYTRAVELYHLNKTLLALGVTTNSQVVVMGDFNLVASGDWTYAVGPDGVAPFFAPASANGYFVPLGIYKLDLRHADRAATYTWRGDGSFPPSALDHIMVSGPLAGRNPASEIYDVVKDAAGLPGLPKFGNRPPSGSSYGSDHLPVFADLDIRDPGMTFGTWAGGAPRSSANVLRYAVGGATGPAATNGAPSTTALRTNALSLTAIVRTNDPNLKVAAKATSDLARGPWTTNGITAMDATDQSAVPSGTVRRTFTIDGGTNTRMFLRLEAVLF